MMDRGGRDGGHSTGKTLGYDRGNVEDYPIDTPDDRADGEVGMPYRMLLDDEAWVRVGEELRRLDPARYIALLQVLQDAVAIRKDPIRARRQASGTFVFPKPGKSRNRA